MKKYKKDLLYVGLISLIWLVTYVLCTVLWEQKLGWDEVNYLGIAKGIAEDFDFGARFYTIMGIIKHGYPTHFINFPISSIYLALFLKLFGMNMHVAYFSTWLAALGVCILIYFIFNILSEDRKKLSFIVSMSYLFCPGIIKNCDTAMMEQFGCLLLCIFVFLILKDFKRGILNVFTAFKFAIAFLVLWLYKSLFVGIFFGAFLLICFAFNKKLSKKAFKTTISLPLFLLISYGLFTVTYYIFQKFVFLKVAPMVAFSWEKQSKQIYADFLGGFFIDFPKELIINVNYFFDAIVSNYFVYPTLFSPYAYMTFTETGKFLFVGLYFFLFMLCIALIFACWKDLLPFQKGFVLFSCGSMFALNMGLVLVFSAGFGNTWRYNLYSLPLYLCFVFLILYSNFKHAKPFVSEHPRLAKVITSLFFVFIYIPLFLSLINSDLILEGRYHNTAKQNTEIIKKYIGISTPKFVYFNDGTHITWDRYPIRQVMKDATNEQLIEVNMILPEPIEFLFISNKDWLFKNNKDDITMAKSIINNEYSFYGFENDAQIVVYRFTNK